MEKDGELHGEGNAYDFGARIYDSRLGRWLSLDPLMSKYPDFSPYNFTLNNPIYFVDPDGRDPRWGQLANINQIIGVMKLHYANNEGLAEKTVIQQYSAFSRFFSVDMLYDRNKTGNLYIKQDGPLRYIHTEKAGWVDMKHFFLILKQSNLGDAYAGLVADFEESFQSGETYYAYEDFTSNQVAIQFLEKYDALIRAGELSLVEAMEEFFVNDLVSTNPEDAPNYDEIPHVVNPDTNLKWTKQQYNDEGPLTGGLLEAVYSEHYGSWSEYQQSTVSEAHQEYSADEAQTVVREKARRK